MDFSINHNFRHVEIIDSPLLDISSYYLERIEENGLNVSVHAPLLKLCDEKSVISNANLLKETILRAKTWKSNVLVTHTGVLPPGVGRESALRAIKSVIEENLDTLEQNDIVLCLENVGYLGNDLICDFYQLADLTDTFPEKLVGIAFDISHAVITGGVPNGLDILGSRIRHIHISDGKQNMDIHHLPLGEGSVDFSALKDRTLNCTGIMEIRPDGHWKRNIMDGRILLETLNIAISKE